MVDPERIRTLMLNEAETDFPEDVAYLFHKQMEEADIIVLNKIDLISGEETARLLKAIRGNFEGRRVIAVSAKEGNGMDHWIDDLLSSRPGANTVLRQIDYDRYAHAEAVLGWLNAAVKVSSINSFDPGNYLHSLAVKLREAFKPIKAEIGHLKFVVTNAGNSMWANLTGLTAEPVISGQALGSLSRATIIINARVRLEPEQLESIVRETLRNMAAETGVQADIDDLQCFSPAYPEPAHIMREPVE
jgi:hypothetical protein